MGDYSPGDIVVVPFPFTDGPRTKRRPALVCSSPEFNASSQHVVLAMITTSTRSAWPGDVSILDQDASGLPAPSVVRWKLFTLDASLVLRRAGALSTRDRAACVAKQPLGL